MVGIKYKRDAIAPGGHLQGDSEQAEYFCNAIECDVEKMLKSRRTFNKNSYDLFTVA